MTKRVSRKRITQKSGEQCAYSDMDFDVLESVLVDRVEKARLQVAPPQHWRVISRVTTLDPSSGEMTHAQTFDRIAAA